MKTLDKKIKIAIIDDDTMVSNLLKDYLELHGNITTLFIDNSGNQFLKRLEKTSEFPHIILLDLRMKNGDGLHVLDTIAATAKPFKIIVISSHYDLCYIGQMLKKGCDAFLPKEIDPQELIEIIHTVHKKGTYFSEEQVGYIRKQISTKSPQFHINTINALTNRELEVLKLLSQQLTTKQIAEKLFLSVKTIEMHKSNLLVKTGTRNSIGLVIYAIQNQLIDPNNVMLLG